jgi:hypothetical protein
MFEELRALLDDAQAKVEKHAGSAGEALSAEASVSAAQAALETAQAVEAADKTAAQAALDAAAEKLAEIRGSLE